MNLQTLVAKDKRKTLGIAWLVCWLALGAFFLWKGVHPDHGKRILSGFQSKDLRARYEELADSEIADDDFTNKLLAEEQTWIEQFLTASQNSNLQGSRVIFWDAEDEQPIRDVMI